MKDLRSTAARDQWRTLVNTRTQLWAP